MIVLRDRTVKYASVVGDVYLHSKVTLTRVLYVPDFKRISCLLGS